MSCRQVPTCIKSGSEKFDQPCFFFCDFSRMCVWVCVCWLYIFVKMENKLFCRLKLVNTQTANISFFRVPNLTTLVSCERFTYLGEKKKR